jgi:aryl-alcohol dehydrogenase-like predicted oxidoreductase
VTSKPWFERSGLGHVPRLCDDAAVTDRRQVGASRLERLGFGCVKLGSASNATSTVSAKRLIRAAVHTGITFFDTADAYGSGTSERILGSALRSDRSKVVVATKGGYLFRDRSRLERGARLLLGPALARRRSAHSAPTTGPGLAMRTRYDAQDFTPAYLRRAVDASLHRLQTDYIDVYQVHGPSSLCTDETLELMDELIRVGKIRKFGVGLEGLYNAPDWLQVRNVTSLQVPFGILDPEARAMFSAAHQADVDLIARGVFGSGLFNEVRTRDSAAQHDPNDAKRDLVDGIRLLAHEAGVKPHQVAVWWVLAQRAITTMLIGINSVDHLQSTVAYVMSASPPEGLLTRVEQLVETHAARGEGTA